MIDFIAIGVVAAIGGAVAGFIHQAFIGKVIAEAKAELEKVKAEYAVLKSKL